ncbi:hypothetical protein [Paenibacillus barengoltzii]|uniref:hypothetical protein n=1 Tax=Paenibacillus barengoltzii TaxID=343517 RepID=UPI003879A7AF
MFLVNTLNYNSNIMTSQGMGLQMKKIALLAMILLCTFSSLTVLAEEESIDFTLYQYMDPEDIPEDISGNRILVFVEESFSNDQLEEIRNEMKGRSYDWRTDLPLDIKPIYVEDQNMTLQMYFDLQSDVMDLAHQIENRADLYNIDKWGSFLSLESYALYQNYLASFQTMIPEIQNEMEYARAYSQFVKGLTEEESRNLFGPMLTQEMDAEQTIQTAEAALGQLDYLYRLKLQYLQFPKELSGEELQQAIHEHGFTGAEGEASLQSDEKSVALPASEPASQNPGGIPWGRMLGWTIIGSVLGWLGKKTLDRLRAVVAKKFVESVKNASPEERKAMLKNYQQGTKNPKPSEYGSVKNR